MARGTEPLLGLEWDTDQDLRNGDPKIRIRLTDGALDRLVVQGKAALFEVEILVESRSEFDAEGWIDQTVVIEIDRAS